MLPLADAGPAADGLLTLLGAFGYGIGSALIPVLNAEAFVAVIGGTSRHWVLGVVALSLGTTVGKVIIMQASRRGAGWLQRWDARRQARASDKAARRGAERPPGPWAVRRKRWGEALLHQLDRPLVSGLVVLLSASIGIPPLALVAVLAGVRRTPVLVFAVAVFVGRVGRFLLVAAPFAAAVT